MTYGLPDGYDINKAFGVAGFSFGRPTGSPPNNPIFSGVYGYTNWDALVRLFSDSTMERLVSQAERLATLPATAEPYEPFDYALASEIVRACLLAGRATDGRTLQQASLQERDYRVSFVAPTTAIGIMQEQIRSLIQAIGVKGNPVEPVSGPKGERGIQGEQGIQGEDGAAFVLDRVLSDMERLQAFVSLGAGQLWHSVENGRLVGTALAPDIGESINRENKSAYIIRTDSVFVIIMADYTNNRSFLTTSDWMTVTRASDGVWGTYAVFPMDLAVSTGQNVAAMSFVIGTDWLTSAIVDDDVDFDFYRVRSINAAETEAGGWLYRDGQVVVVRDNAALGDAAFSNPPSRLTTPEQIAVRSVIGSPAQPGNTPRALWWRNGGWEYAPEISGEAEIVDQMAEVGDFYWYHYEPSGVTTGNVSSTKGRFSLSDVGNNSVLAGISDQEFDLLISNYNPDEADLSRAFSSIKAGNIIHFRNWVFKNPGSYREDYESDIYFKVLADPVSRSDADAGGSNADNIVYWTIRVEYMIVGDTRRTSTNGSPSNKQNLITGSSYSRPRMNLYIQTDESGWYSKALSTTDLTIPSSDTNEWGMLTFASTEQEGFDLMSDDYNQYVAPVNGVVSGKVMVQLPDLEDDDESTTFSVWFGKDDSLTTIPDDIEYITVHPSNVEDAVSKNTAVFTTFVKVEAGDILYPKVSVGHTYPRYCFEAIMTHIETPS